MPTTIGNDVIHSICFRRIMDSLFQSNRYNEEFRVGIIGFVLDPYCFVSSSHCMSTFCPYYLGLYHFFLITLYCHKSVSEHILIRKIRFIVTS